MSTSSQYALVEAGVVVNVILWDGVSEWIPPANQQPVQIPEGSNIAIGWTYDGATFSPPVGSG